MLAVAAASFTISMGAFLAGAWPVFGFMGLDVLLAYVALRASLRSARVSETLELDQDMLTVERMDARGRTRSWRLQPAWLRVELPRTGPKAAIVLRSHGHALPVGAFLSDDQRAAVAAGLRNALARWRLPGPQCSDIADPL
jgi:uncharacterized membrane protein